MHNVTYEVKADKLTIVVDLSPKAIKDAPPSASGKTNLLATTGGSVPIVANGASISFALNVMVKK